MKLDELLKKNSSPIEDAGFTDRVFRNLTVETAAVPRVGSLTVWLAGLDLLGVQILALASIVVYFASRFSIDPGAILNGFVGKAGLVVVLSLVLAALFLDEPLFE